MIRKLGALPVIVRDRFDLAIHELAGSQSSRLDVARQVTQEVQKIDVDFRSRRRCNPGLGDRSASPGQRRTIQVQQLLDHRRQLGTVTEARNDCGHARIERRKQIGLQQSFSSHVQHPCECAGISRGEEGRARPRVALLSEDSTCGAPSRTPKLPHGIGSRTTSATLFRSIPITRRQPRFLLTRAASLATHCSAEPAGIASAAEHDRGAIQPSVLSLVDA